MPCMQRSPIPQNPVLKHGLFVGSAYTQCRDMHTIAIFTKSTTLFKEIIQSTSAMPISTTLIFIRSNWLSNNAMSNYSNPHFCKAESRVPAYSGNCWYTALLKVSANISTMSFRLFVKESKSLTGWKHKPPMHRSPSGQLPQRPQRSPDGSA
ncbi:hypothetical protein T02_16323 [Trichinella nativa]|uniref:Uncharacterized protein n=1 Tax=Trichinella nativa TaxID=6335 RepID=A0A0V1KTT2_9BILA|nr:hypothetical protein T02_16323 [Trichinella nativa]